MRGKNTCFINVTPVLIMYDMYDKYKEDKDKI